MKINKNQLVTLLHHTPLEVCSHAVRTCWESHEQGDDGGPKDRKLIEKVGNQFKHSSTLEHLNYNFFIQGVSRALLQELARHRIASLSVKSTRYTLKELESERTFVNRGKSKLLSEYDMDRVAEYCVLTGDSEVDYSTAVALENTRRLKAQKIPNDKAKFAIPDAYKTKLTWSINARSLQNFLFLRTATAAMWEIRILAYAIYDALPESHKYLFTHCVSSKEEKKV